MRNPPWLPVAILGGCRLRHTLHIGKRRVRSTVFGTRAQKRATARETRSILAVLFSCGPGHVAGGSRRFGCAVIAARVVSMMRLHACQCHPHELPGPHWHVLGAHPHGKETSHHTRNTDNSSWLFRVSTSRHRFLALLFSGHVMEGEEVVCQLCRR